VSTQTHWDDGTPYSTGNAFCPAKPSGVDPKEKQRLERVMEYDEKLKRLGKTRKGIAKGKATRANQEVTLAAFIPKSVRAPR
jgi:hypothetical protein